MPLVAGSSVHAVGTHTHLSGLIWMWWIPLCTVLSQTISPRSAQCHGLISYVWFQAEKPKQDSQEKERERVMMNQQWCLPHSVFAIQAKASP